MVDGRASPDTAAYDSDATVGNDDLSGDRGDILSPAHDSDTTVREGDSDTDGEGSLSPLSLERTMPLPYRLHWSHS